MDLLLNLFSTFFSIFFSKGLLDIFLIHNNSIIGNIITILISVIIFILDDFSLSEIFTPKDENNKNYVRNTAAASSAFSIFGM